MSRFTHFLEIFEQKKVPFGVKNSVFWARSALLHGIYCTFHDAFGAKIVNMRLTKIFIAIFAPDERLPSKPLFSFATDVIFEVGSTDRLLNYVWYGSGAGRLRTLLRAIL